MQAGTQPREPIPFRRYEEDHGAREDATVGVDPSQFNYICLNKISYKLSQG